jgi:hypothetical protein
MLASHNWAAGYSHDKDLIAALRDNGRIPREDRDPTWNTLLSTWDLGVRGNIRASTGELWEHVTDHYLNDSNGRYAFHLAEYFPTSGNIRQDCFVFRSFQAGTLEAITNLGARESELGAVPMAVEQCDKLRVGCISTVAVIEWPKTETPKGICLHFNGIAGRSPEKELIETFLHKDWIVCSISQPSDEDLNAQDGLGVHSFNYMLQDWLALNDKQKEARARAGLGPVSGQELASRVDRYFSEYGAVSEAALSVIRLDPRTTNLPVVVVGLSGGALAVPGVCAFSNVKPSAAVICLGGGSLLDIAIDSPLMSGKIDNFISTLQKEHKMDQLKAEYLAHTSWDPLIACRHLPALPILRVEAFSDGIIPARDSKRLAEQMSVSERLGLIGGHFTSYLFQPLWVGRVEEWAESKVQGEAAVTYLRPH